MHPASRAVSVALLMLPFVACSGFGPEPEVEEPVTYFNQSIMGGVDDKGDPAVVGILHYSGWSAGICSGSLIAPNLVLTARHCVAQVSEQVICSSSQFGSVHPANQFFVTTEWNGLEVAFQTQQLIGTWFRVHKVIVPADSADVCGYDIALVQLTQNVDPNIAEPIVPRVDQVVRAGEMYRAVGYGTTSDSDMTGSSAGRRRMLESLRVRCSGTCAQYIVDNAHEWQGERGVCQGDSGGPALDEQGRVIGVVSRGGAGCTTPIYGAVASWADWIKEHAATAAREGNYQPAPWVTGASTNPGAGGSGGSGGSSGSGGTGGEGSQGSSGKELGEACTASKQCASKVCVAENNLSMYCSTRCTAEDPCPEGYKCSIEAGLCFMPGAFQDPCNDDSECRSHMCVGGRCTQSCEADDECPTVQGRCDTAAGQCYIQQASTIPPLDEGGCAVSTAPSARLADPTKPIPWAIVPALAALAVLRRRRE